MKDTELVKYIDHANHSATSTVEEIRELCNEVKRHGFNAAFVNACWVDFARQVLGDEGKVGTVVSFPLGQDTTQAKGAAVLNALENGVDEIDVSANVGLLKEGKEDEYLEELVQLVSLVKSQDSSKIIKFIIEAVLLEPEEIKTAAKLVLESGADFVKTTSGFGPRDAKIEFVKLIRQAVGDQIRVKAAGGIHTREEVEAYIEAGADRIGTSAGVAIITGQEPKDTSE
jgi:deoxyribose-phosphate aldolase